jgi:hypothetical protein
MDETVTSLLLYLPYLYLLVDVTRKSDRRLATFIIFFPGFFGLVGIQAIGSSYVRARRHALSRGSYESAR